MSIIDIHEFSTGINVQGTPDNWWSVGFSGGYMNSTLSYIPRSVQQEIAADLFYLSEFAVQKKPAIIGREVKLGQEEWSVLAVITHAKDESERGISVSRYFLTEGLGKLNDLLTYQQSNNLTFNPFDNTLALNNPTLSQYPSLISSNGNLTNISFILIGKL